MKKEAFPMPMRLSARNQLRAKVVSVTLDAVMAEVVMELADGQHIISAITRTSAESLDLKAGDEVFAIVKSTEVMVGKNE
jgi:molybdate transport system regulatory protein